MTKDPLQLLSRANPVPALPPVDGIERLRALIDEREELVRAPLGDVRRRLRRRSPAVVLVIAALGGLGLLLGDGSSGPGTNVLAAAYAATSGGGLLEASYVTRRISHGHFAGGFSVVNGSSRAVIGVANRRACPEAPPGEHRQPLKSQAARDGSNSGPIPIPIGWACFGAIDI